FQPAATNLAGSAIGSVALGDFNGDGKTDLVVSSAASCGQGFTNYGVLVLLGNGDGTFQPAYTVAQRSGFVSGGGFVAVGDFNSDGKSDLATALISAICDRSIDLLLGNGDGTFQAAITTVMGSGIQGMALGDFNGDGKPDLAAVHYGQYDQNRMYTNIGLSVLLGNGDGTFQTASNYIGADVFGVAVGDFNGDGKSDLAVGTRRSTGVVLLLGNGDGSFQTVVNTGTAAFPGSLVASDFNGDGKLDLGVAGFISVNLGNGDGTFQTALNFDPGGFNGTGSGAAGLAAGDFNGDGKPDL